MEPSKDGEGPDISYYTAKTILQKKFPNVTPQEIAMWVFMGDLRSYDTKEVDHRDETIPLLPWTSFAELTPFVSNGVRRGFVCLGIDHPFEERPYTDNFESFLFTTFFCRHEVETFDPDGVNLDGQQRLGRWLTIKQLIKRWRAKYPQESEDSLMSLVETHHRLIADNDEIQFGSWFGDPSEAKPQLAALNPTGRNGVANAITEGTFQLQQVEALETQYFGDGFPPRRKPTAERNKLWQDAVDKLYWEHKGEPVWTHSKICKEIAKNNKKLAAGADAETIRRCTRKPQ